MTKTERELLDKINRAGPLWDHGIGLPISREEGEAIRRCLLRHPIKFQHINEPWLPTR